MNTCSNRISAVSLLLLAACAMAACGNTAEGSLSDTSPSSAPTDTTAVTETYVKADVPQKDFGGETFTIYGRVYEGTWSANDILSHKEDGEQINDALYARTVYMEDTFNVTLELIESGEDECTHVVKNHVTAGDAAFDAVVCSTYNAGALSVDGMLLDLNNVANLDLSREWWAQTANRSMSVAGKQFYVTGDLFITDNQATRIFYFNKDIIRDLDMEDPYTLVENNAWTIEKYLKLSEEAVYDLNGDGKMTREADRWGTMAQEFLGSALYLASGNLMTDKDSKDLPYAVCATEKALSVMVGISEMIAGKPSISLCNDIILTQQYPDNLVYFTEGRALFSPEVLMHIESMRDSTVDIGILPPPKYDASQERYYCFADGYCVNVVSIPATNTASGDAGLLLEAMAADSLNNLTPAYFDVALTDKYARDEQSVRMLDLIIDSSVMDNAEVFGWGGISGTISSAIYNGTAIASEIEKKLPALEKAIEKTVIAIEAITE